MLYAVHLLYVFSLLISDVKARSGVFTMTFSSIQIVYIDLCYTEWPSSAGKFLHSPCLFHPQPYSYTIHPGYPFKIGRPLQDILSDYISVVINVTDNGGDRRGSIRERFIVDGSLPNRSITLDAELLTVDFAITCESDYFGPRCARFCKPYLTEHHFACSSTGEKICLTGWKGENCSIVQDDAEGNRVSSYISRSKERSEMLSLVKFHSGKHMLLLGAVMFSALFVGYVLCAPRTQPAADLQADHYLLSH